MLAGWDGFCVKASFYASCSGIDKYLRFILPVVAITVPEVIRGSRIPLTLAAEKPSSLLTSFAVNLSELSRMIRKISSVLPSRSIFLMGDVSAYIPTNIISITDGQIYLEADLFNSGVKPAINIGLSVSRVGGSAQIKPMKQVAGQLRLDLAQYRELAAFAQFGSDLDDATKQKLSRGARMVELLKQDQYQPVSVALQVALIYSGTNGYLDDLPVNEIRKFAAELIKYLQEKGHKTLNEIAKNQKVVDQLEKNLQKLLNEFKQKYLAAHLIESPLTKNTGGSNGAN